MMGRENVQPVMEGKRGLGTLLSESLLRKNSFGKIFPGDTKIKNRRHSEARPLKDSSLTGEKEEDSPPRIIKGRTLWTLSLQGETTFWLLLRERRSGRPLAKKV